MINISLTTNTSGGNTTATLTRTAPNAKMNAVLTDAAHFIWQDILDAEGNVITSWATATNAQKLAQLETAMVNFVLNLAKSYNTTTDVEAARVTAETENAANYEF